MAFSWENKAPRSEHTPYDFFFVFIPVGVITIHWPPHPIYLNGNWRMAFLGSRVAFSAQLGRAVVEKIESIYAAQAAVLMLKFKY